MPNLLAPTVAERLAKCGERVTVLGVMPGSDVTLRVNGTDYTETIDGGAYTFNLPRPLVEGERVRVRQRLGPDESEWSPEVEVEDVALPPNPPLTEPSIPRCGTCVLAWGVAPGSRVFLESGGGVIADGQAGRFGERCLKLEDYPRSSTGVFSSTETCGTPSATRHHISVHQEAHTLPTPVIPQPVFGCQTRVGLSGLVPGSLVEITVTDRDGTERNYYLRTCWSSVNANLGDELAMGDRLTARQTMAEHDWDCNSVSGRSAPVEAVRPDERIKPVILEPVYEGDRMIQVTDQIEGGLVTVYCRNRAEDPEEDLGSRSSSQFPEVPVPALRAGQILRVAQELCEVLEYSEPVTVLALPAVLEAPRVRSPLYACASMVMVENVLPGAMVHLLQSVPHDTEPEYPIGQAWAAGPNQAVRVYPILAADAYVRAYQVAGGQTSPLSDRVPVGRVERIPAPTVGDPVLVGSLSVWVRDIIPGAYVRVFDDGEQIGGGSVALGQAWITVYRPITENSIITARQMLCLDESAESAPVPATPGPCDGAPPYEPEAWNDNDWIQCCNNCYNYGCNLRTDTFAQPGYASTGFGGPYYGDCDAVSDAALSDGLRRCTDICHPCHHKVALVTVPGGDYHWYRQDAGGLWSHKMGQSEATNRDNSHNLITDPATANRGAYTNFCGYFCVYEPDVTIDGYGCTEDHRARRCPGV